MLANFQGSFKVINCDLFNESFRGILLHVGAFIYSCTLFYGTTHPSILWLLVSFLLLIFLDKRKKREIEMKLNQAYETLSLQNPCKPATQVYTKPCPAYDSVVQAHHWGLDDVYTAFGQNYVHDIA